MLLLVAGLIVVNAWSRAGGLPVVPLPPGATTRIPEGERYETRVDNLAQAMTHTLEGGFGRTDMTVHALPGSMAPAEAVAFIGRSLGGDWSPVPNRCRQRGHPVDVPGRRFITACRWVENVRWWPRAVEVAAFDRLDRIPPPYWPKDVTLLVVATARAR